jgi:hypothetical protein
MRPTKNIKLQANLDPGRAVFSGFSSRNGCKVVLNLLNSCMSSQLTN